MNGFVVFIIVMGILVFLSLLVVAVVMLFKLKMVEKVDDSNIVFNFASHRTKGHSVGYLKSVVQARNGRKVVTYWVKDAEVDDKDRLGSHKKTTVIVDRNKIVTIPKLALSGGKNITFLFPNRGEELSESLRSNSFGMAIAGMIEKTSNDRSIEDVLRETMALKDAHAMKVKEGEWSMNHLATLQRLAEETSKIKDPDKKLVTGLGVPKQ